MAGVQTWLALILLIVGLIVGISFTVSAVNENKKKQGVSSSTVVWIIIGYLAAVIGLIWLVVAASKKSYDSLASCYNGCEVNQEKCYNSCRNYRPGSLAYQTCITDCPVNYANCIPGCREAIAERSPPVAGI